MFVDDTKNPKPHPYLEIIPSTWMKWLKEDIKEIKGEITNLQEAQEELIMTLENIKIVCEDLARCATEPKDVL